MQSWCSESINGHCKKKSKLWIMLPCLEKPEQTSNLKNFSDSWSASEQEQSSSDRLSYLPHSVFDRRFCAVSHHLTCPGRHTTSSHRPSFLPLLTLGSRLSADESICSAVFALLRGPAQPLAPDSERIPCRAPVITSGTEENHHSSRCGDTRVRLRPFLLIWCRVSKKKRKRKDPTRPRWRPLSATGSALFSSLLATSSQWATLLISPLSLSSPF